MLALLVVLTVALPIGAGLGAGQARAASPAAPSLTPAIAGAPTLQGYYIVGHGAALVAIGYVGWADVWTGAGNGSQVFSSAFYLALFNLKLTNVSVPLAVRERGSVVYNGSVVINPLSQNVVTIPLPSITAWTTVTIYFFGVPTWTGQVATPISLLPNYILNVGGLDLFAIGLVSFSLIMITVGVTVGRWTMRRAVFAPKFTALIWFHVVLLAILGFVVVDFQFVDATFAGLSPLVYPLILLPMAFFWALSLFNRAPLVQIQNTLLTGADEMGFLLTELRVGRLPNGKLVPIGDGFKQYFARFCGHNAAPFDSGDPTKPRAWLAPAAYALSPTASVRERIKARKQSHLPRPDTAEALLKYPVLNAPIGKDAVAFIAFGKGPEAPEIAFPYLTVHRIHDVVHDAERSADGTIVKPAWTEKKRKLSLPHYVDPDPSKPPELEDHQFETAYAVWSRYAAIRDLGRLYSKICHAFAALSASVESRINDETYSQLRTHYALVGRVSSGITEEEAEARSGALAGLLAPKKPEGSP